MIALLSGNGRALLTVDERGAWKELYYPYPGLHQHLHQARLGLYDEDTEEFTWVDQEGKAPTSMSYHGDSNIAHTELDRMGLEVGIDDLVHPSLDMIIRRVGVQNPDGTARDVRLFHYQSLNTANTLHQETAYWDESRETVTHYKRGYYFQLCGRPAFDAYTCGEHSIKGLQGSYVDAEDGQLEGNPISHGVADSVVQWNLEVPPGESQAAYLFVLIGGSRSEVNEFYRETQSNPPDVYTDEALGYWTNWAANRHIQPASDLSDRSHEVYKRSLFVLQDCQASNGSIIASPDSQTLKSDGDNYCYCWWRDGALISRALSEVGLHRNAVAFLRFADKAQEDEGYFLHRHFPDGSVGSTWHPPPFLQLDQTAVVIDAVRYYYECAGAVDELLPSWELVRDAADFVMESVDEDGLPHSTYDLWEENKSVNTYTVATAIQGLRAAAQIADALGKRSQYWAQAADEMHEAALDALWNPDKETFYKSIDPVDDAVDASTLLALQMGLLGPSDPRYRKVVEAVEDRLWVDDTGGIARYEGDDYYGHENPWLICTLWLARCHLDLGNRHTCGELIDWVASQSTPTRLLPEQIDRQTHEPTSVTPLVWSHSTFIETVDAYTRLANRNRQAPVPRARRTADREESP